MTKKGFSTFGFHTYSRDAANINRDLFEERANAPSFSLTEESGGLQALDPETAARQHLQLMLASSALPEMDAPQIEEKKAEFRTIGVETLPLTGTRTVKFRQTYDRIPVYGSLITVELDDKNDLMAVNSSIGSPENVDGIASISADEAIKAVRADANPDEPINSTPQLSYYMDPENNKWHLAYLVEDVPQDTDTNEAQAQYPLSMDYWVDAHSGQIVAKRPRSANANGSVTQQNIPDGLGNPRDIRCFNNAAGLHLQDDLFNVHTFDFAFQDIISDNSSLPGTYIANPPTPWNDAAVSAHANAADVAGFLRNVLRRNGVDNLGGRLVSSVNCIVRKQSPNNQEWRNAAWFRDQMVYGQRQEGGKLVSYAVGLDIVAHEIFHGVTDKTAGLVYAAESGALNESYSDIFGIIVSNSGQSNISHWNWELGEDLNAAGIPLRDLEDPTRFNQPAHMNDYRNLPVTPPGDWGGVHVNSGIHNNAAYKIMSATDQTGGHLFTPELLAALFYIALTQYLTRNSVFADSRRAIMTAAQTLFRNDTPGLRNNRLNAINSAFDAVGVS